MIKIFIPIEKWQLLQFKLYTNYFINNLQLDLLKSNTEVDNNDEQIKKLKVKVNHSIDVANDSKKIAIELGLFNSANVELIWTCGLLHDIGRFMQLVKTGTFKDYDSFEKDTKLSSLLINNRSIVDHGELGQIILKDAHLITRFIPFTRSYDNFVSMVVGNHVKVKLPNELTSNIEAKEQLFKEYDLRELIKNNMSREINKLAGWYIKIIQDIDRIDILRQVKRGDFNPKLSNLEEDVISDYAYHLFYNAEYLNMHDIKSRGLWNENVGQLMRWSFIYQISLVSVIKEIKNSELISSVWKKNEVKCLKNADC